MNEVICSDTPGTAETPDPAGFEAAFAAARELAKTLGTGWKGRVWENLGRHYEANSPCGRITVSPFILAKKVHSYSASLHEPGETGMPTFLGQPGAAKTPQGAVTSVVRNVKENVAAINALIEGL